jgi:hypothetical protein
MMPVRSVPTLGAPRQAPMEPQQSSIIVPAGVSFTSVLAHFTDESVAVLGATINWGDGTFSSVAKMTPSPTGGYNLVGSHVYAQPGTYTITVSLVPSAISPGSAPPEGLVFSLTALAVLTGSSPPDENSSGTSPRTGQPQPTSGTQPEIVTPESPALSPSLAGVLLRSLLAQPAGQGEGPRASDVSAQSPWLGRIDQVLPGLSAGSTSGVTPTALSSNRSTSIPFAALPGADATPVGDAEPSRSLPSAARLNARSLLEVQDNHGVLSFLPLPAEGTEADRRGGDTLAVALSLSPEGGVLRDAAMDGSGEFADPASEEDKRGPLSWRWGQAVLRLTVACFIVQVFQRLTTSVKTSPSPQQATSRRRPSAD